MQWILLMQHPRLSQYVCTYVPPVDHADLPSYQTQIRISMQAQPVTIFDDQSTSLNPDIKIILPVTTPDNFSDCKTSTPPTPSNKAGLLVDATSPIGANSGKWPVCP